MDIATIQKRLSKYGNAIDRGDLDEFHAKPEFKRENILFLKKEQYALGLGNKDVFCNWMENKLRGYGSLKGGSSSVFGIWYGTRNKGAAPIGYQCIKKYENSPFDIDKSFEAIKKDLLELLIAGEYEDYQKIDNNKLANIFKSKILSVYYPEKYLCIFKKEHLINIKNLLEIELFDEDSIWDIKKSIFEWQKEHMPHLNIWSFMQALYKEFYPEIDGEYTSPKKTLTLYSIDYIKTINLNIIVGGSGKPPNYQEKQAKQSRVGRNGEELVLEYERQKLKGYRKQPVDFSMDLSKHFDILSYDMTTGNEIHIEVKTKNNFKEGLDFYLTNHEKHQLENDPYYALYYVTDIYTQPKLFIIDITKMQGETPEIVLEPTVYRVLHEVKIKS